jgi:hypothetical protein
MKAWVISSDNNIDVCVEKTFNKMDFGVLRLYYSIILCYNATPFTTLTARS